MVKRDYENRTVHLSQVMECRIKFHEKSEVKIDY